MFTSRVLSPRSQFCCSVTRWFEKNRPNLWKKSPNSKSILSKNLPKFLKKLAQSKLFCQKNLPKVKNSSQKYAQSKTFSHKWRSFAQSGHTVLLTPIGVCLSRKRCLIFGEWLGDTDKLAHFAPRHAFYPSWRAKNLKRPGLPKTLYILSSIIDLRHRCFWISYMSDSVMIVEFFMHPQQSLP